MSLYASFVYGKLLARVSGLQLTRCRNSIRESRKLLH
jgi:hypothetical protein